MNTKKIREHNPQKFLTDLKNAYSLMVYVDSTGTFFQVTKRELLKVAGRRKIEYYMTRNNLVQCDVMIVI